MTLGRLLGLKLSNGYSVEALCGPGRPPRTDVLSLSTPSPSDGTPEPAPHPCAPQSVIDSFSRFSEARQNPIAPRQDAAASSSYGGGPTSAELKSQGQGSGSSSSGGAAAGGVLENESQLPKWLRRDRYAPTEEEMDAVMVSFAPPPPSSQLA